MLTVSASPLVKSSSTPVLLGYDLNHQNVLVVGGTSFAVELIDTIQSVSKASVTVVSQTLHPALKPKILAGEFAWFNRSFDESTDLSGKFLVLIALDESQRSIAKHVSSLCVAQGSLVYSVDPQVPSNVSFIPGNGFYSKKNQIEDAIETIDFEHSHMPMASLQKTLIIRLAHSDSLSDLSHRLLSNGYSTNTELRIYDHDVPLQHTSVKRLGQIRLSSSKNLSVVLGPLSDYVASILNSFGNAPIRLPISPALSPSPSDKVDTRKLEYMTGSKALSRVLYSVSDLILGMNHPSLNANLEALAEWKDEGIRNIQGIIPELRVLDSRLGVGSIINGALSFLGHAAILLASPSLQLILPALSAMKKHCPVLHIDATRVNPHDLTLSSDLAMVYQAAHAGYLILSSWNVQDVVETSLLSHLFSRCAHMPVIHAFDGLQLHNVRSKLHVLPEELNEIVQAFETSDDGILGKIHAVFSHASSALGSHVSPFEYKGHPSPDTVFVTTGSAHALVEPAIHQLVSDGSKVGVLYVRLIRPWLSAEFLKFVPQSVQHLLVIDGTKHKLLTQDIRLSLVTSRRKIGLKHLNLDDAHSHPAYIQKLYYSQVHGVDHDIADFTSLYDSKHFNALFLDRVQDTTEIASSFLGEYLETLPNHHVHVTISNLTAYLSPAKLKQVRFGASPIDESYPITSADLVAVQDIKLLSEFAVIDRIKPNGRLFIATNLKGSELFEAIPAHVLEALIKKSVSIYTLPTKQISKDFTIFYGTPTEYTQTILKAIFLKLTFGNNSQVHLEKLKNHIKDSADSVNIKRTKLGAVDRALEELSVHLPAEFTQYLIQNIESGEDLKSLRPSAPIKPEWIKSCENQASTPITLDTKVHPTWPWVFPRSFGLLKATRPEAETTFLVSVTENSRLTPDSYDRNVFHMELDIKGTGLKYAIGDALGVYAQNDPVLVRKFLEAFGMDAHESVRIEHVEHPDAPIVEYRTIEQMLVQHLDLFGKPGKKFYQLLAEKAQDPVEAETLWLLVNDKERLETFVEKETPTYADLIQRFPSVSISKQELIESIPYIKPRHYSIASSQRVHPDSVHLLIVLVDWKTASGEQRYGQATRYLVNAKIGQQLKVSIKNSVMKLPERHEDPVIMAGLGTGMAPFRAFIEERWYWKSQGRQIGPMVLYFGSRHRSQEYLYGEELEAYHADKVLSHLGLAFSRDQKEKVYIQHKIQEDAQLLNELLVQKHGHFYLCGPTWPVPDVTNALVHSFSSSMSETQAREYIEELKNNERFILEVY